MEYLDDKLNSYREADIYPFHMPGHKRKTLPFPNPFSIDITEIDGFDNLHHATGILKQAQERAASLYGARHTFYLVNGSTCGILAAICAAVPKRGKILIARNSHSCVYHACCLNELSVEYLYPVLTRHGILGQVTPQQVEKALSESPDIAAVVVTSPTYEGIVSDITGIAKITHMHRIPLIVDEAHGAHFGFGGGFPENATKLGADAVVMSLHKTLPSFTQTALLHLCSDRISLKKIQKYLDIFETSSPSYLFMAGMESCIRTVEQEKKRLFLNFRMRLEDFYLDCMDLRVLHLLRREDLTPAECFDWDDSKLVIFTTNASCSGRTLYDLLLHRYRLQPEMAGTDYCLAMTSIADTTDGFSRLCTALHEIDAYLGSNAGSLIPNRINTGQLYKKNPRNMQMFEAESADITEVSLNQAAGLTSAAAVRLYPPGVPMIVPGEVITAELILAIQSCLQAGLTIQGCTTGDCTVKIEVVAM